MIRLIFLVGVSWAGALLASPTWEIVRVGRVDYVSLKSFAKFYGFTIPNEIEPNRPFVMSSAQGNLRMTLESREMRWKGVRYWLSHSLRRVDGKVLVPRVDLVKYLAKQRIHMSPRVMASPLRCGLEPKLQI